MRIYKHTLKHQGWEDDINEFAIYTTWPMNRHEFVKYYNKNIAGKSIEGCEDYGVVHNIYRFGDKVDIFPWLEYVIDEDDGFDDLKFSDDSDKYTFRRCSFNIIELDTEEE